MYIEVKDVSVNYDNNFQALNHVSLSIEKGEFICLLGPSGCGKTTLLNSIAGFEKVTEGEITIDGKKVTKPVIDNITIFQNYGLLPWRTVQKNIEFGLEIKKIPKEQRKDIAKKYIDMVGLSKFINSRPHQLSGGMQQRVAIARALAINPDIIFMDEPLGALDAITRMKLQDDILKLSKSEKKTIIFVTHDIEEAVFLADRIVIMTPNPGKIKSIVNMTIPHTRDRTSENFLYARDKIFEIFNMKSEHKPAPEYFI
ncbi:MAG: ABC transporter ATP-binding protein [Ruminococcus sp.]|nr:ABC transporter ATP-binding protein [Ruminococcus sp.]MCD7799813.1 ABC transporter ATP-binding protein [Ruminococcus sp.]